MKSKAESQLENVGVVLFLGLFVFMTIKFMRLVTIIVQNLAVDSTVFVV